MSQSETEPKESSGRQIVQRRSQSCYSVVGEGLGNFFPLALCDLVTNSGSWTSEDLGTSFLFTAETAFLAMYFKTKGAKRT